MDRGTMSPSRSTSSFNNTKRDRRDQRHKRNELKSLISTQGRRCAAVLKRAVSMASREEAPSPGNAVCRCALPSALLISRHMAPLRSVELVEQQPARTHTHFHANTSAAASCVCVCASLSNMVLTSVKRRGVWL